MWTRLAVDPSVVSEPEQEYGWYYLFASMDGSVKITQTGSPNDTLRLPWHVVPLAASDNGLSESTLDISVDPATMELTEGTAAGISYADLYHLGTTDPAGSHTEEDIVAVGARSFTGADDRRGPPKGSPTGEDEFAGISWLDFLTDDDTPDEPVEIGVQTWGVHNVTETLEVDVLIDAGADGVFADEELQADFMAVKLPAPGGEVCVFALPSTFEDCDALYFADYSNYNSNLVGLVLDAQTIGLADGESDFAYSVTACTGTFSGDVPGTVCDTAGEIDGDSGTWDLVFDAADPALVIDPLVCKGFWDGGDCDDVDPIDVSVGSAGDGGRPLDPGPVPERPAAPYGGGRRDDHLGNEEHRGAGIGLRPIPAPVPRSVSVLSSPPSRDLWPARVMTSVIARSP